jgi:hypothetical protein
MYTCKSCFFFLALFLPCFSHHFHVVLFSMKIAHLPYKGVTLQEHSCSSPIQTFSLSLNRTVFCCRFVVANVCCFRALLVLHNRYCRFFLSYLCCIEKETIWRKSMHVFIIHLCLFVFCCCCFLLLSLLWSFEHFLLPLPFFSPLCVSCSTFLLFAAAC